jgi:hypothetical protein
MELPMHALHTPPLALAPEVIDFATEQGVAPYLPVVLDMTNRIFPHGVQEVVVEDDPEIANDRHIVVLVKATNLDVQQALEARWHWHRGLFETCPAPLVCVFRLGLSIAQ